MKQKYERLIKNTSIFAIGTFGSKILVFLIVPLYTYILSTSEYGIIDLITSSVNLMMPFTTLLIYESAIRFLVGKECREEVVFNNCLVIFILGCLISILISPVILHFLKLNDYFLIFNLLIIVVSYTTIFGQYLRAIGDNWGFSISGIINTLSTVLLNLFFLLYLKKGIYGYLYSLLIAHAVSSIYIFIKCNTLKNINFDSLNFKVLKSMLVYSLPLVPNNIMWWIMNAGDKYVINYFLGASSNGIFSISYKIPTILTMIFSIFMQAWQVSAIEEKDEEARNAFYKSVFNSVLSILAICTSLVIFFVKPIFDYVIGSNFVESWKYVPFLCVATLFNCLSTFAGVVYIVNKNSTKSFYTTFIGAVSNLVFNFMLIRYMGLYGVAIGTIVGYLIVMILRFNDYKKQFNISLLSFKFFMIFLILILDSILYIILEGYLRLIPALICIIILFFLLKKEIIIFVEFLKKKRIFKKNFNEK